MRSSAVGRLAVVLAGIVFVGALAAKTIELAVRLGQPFFDWSFYSAAVHRWLVGEPIYTGGVISTLGSGAGVSYAYPPSSVPLFLPFAGWPLGALAWEAALVAILWSGLWSIVRIGWPASPHRAMALTLLAAAVFVPVLEGLAVGNINIATAGAIGWAWSGARAGSVAPGNLAAFKIFPIALAAPAGSRSLIVNGMIVILIVLVTLPFVGAQAWLDYATALDAAGMTCGAAAHVNLSIACVVSPVVGVTIAKWVGLAIAGMLCLVALRSGRTLLGVTAATGAIMAPATEVHVHYMSFLFVLGVAAVASLAAGRREKAFRTALQGAPSS